ncbi:MAG: hypothetical protein CME70_18185 [Halobacteriovorax sp.]|nr:hypothetical protein [Halobacteriovorax sp.]|tara:strand:+ start:1275 stop:2321 length:1047 start_codon:yes stop_codon:yes gene_type:complete
MPRFQQPLGASDKAQGGAALNQSVKVLDGETELVSVFDDFDYVVPTEAFGGTSNFEILGCVLTDVGSPSNDEIGINDPANVDVWAPSCLRIDTGDTEDTGGNIQFDRINQADPAAGGTFPHLIIPETAAGADALDNQIFTFACRVGLRADDEAGGDVTGNWDSKAFIGFAVAGDTGLMTAGTGALTVAGAAEQLVGFHIPEDGSIDGISQRVGNTAYASGTNFTELVAAGGVDGTVANGSTAAGDPVWFDLAFRMRVTDWSDNNANGTTEFFYRRVRPASGIPGDRTHPMGGRGPAWVKHGTVLTNQVPYHTVALVPTIEVVNGPTADRDGVLYLDWWSFGVSRASRR